jgi:hypothetical protein
VHRRPRDPCPPGCRCLAIIQRAGTSHELPQQSKRVHVAGA